MQLLEQLGLSTSFQAYSLTHGIVTVLTIGAAVAAVRVRRRLAGDPQAARRFDRMLAAACAFLFVIVLVRGLLPGRFSWPRSLPLHVCDMVMIGAIVAFTTGNRTARTVLHYFGLLLTSQAYLTPDLTYGPATVKFYTSWSFHGIIVVAAVVDVFARGYRPGWADYRVGLRVAALYVAVIFPLDAIFKWNYGYIGPADPSTAARLSTLGWFGPWPQRVPLFYVAFALLTAAMTAAWMLAGQIRAAAKNPLPEGVAAPDDGGDLTDSVRRVA